MSGELGDVALEAVRVQRRFGSTTALQDVSLSAGRGEIVGLVGPNGAGKTTLLLILATLLAADEGHVSVCGIDAGDSPQQARRQLGWAPDALGSYDGLTVEELLHAFHRAHGLPRRDARRRSQEVLGEVDAEPLAGRLISTLSRGQRQKVNVARALLHAPAVLLLDEPASGLDPRARVELRSVLRAQAGQGMSVLVSSHDLGELEQLADRSVLIADGRVVREHQSAAGTAGTWRLSAVDPDRLESALHSYGIVFERVDDGAVNASLATDDDAADLNARLVADGVRLTGMTAQTQGLEAAFLEATQAESFDRGEPT
jgi:ABC-2 type transport system ATP-binding protein